MSLFKKEKEFFLMFSTKNHHIFLRIWWFFTYSYIKLLFLLTFQILHFFYIPLPEESLRHSALWRLQGRLL